MKSKEKVIKAGTMVILYTTCNYAGCDSEEEYILPEDMTKSELNEMASELAMETVQPEGWWEFPDEDGE